MTPRSALLYTLDAIRLIACIWIAIYSIRSDWRRVTVLMVMGILLTWIAVMAGCAHPITQARVAPGCLVTTPPPSLPPHATPAQARRANEWMASTWNACASMRAEDYPPAPLYEEAEPGEESDED